MFTHILFATDFSPHAEVAKKVAISLAKGDGKRLWALTVLEPVGGTVDPGRGATRGSTEEVGDVTG